jgi:hypothetical protein
MAAINYEVDGNVTGAGTLNAGTGAATVTFGGSGNQTLSVTNANFNNLTINGTSTLVATTPIGVTGDLTITGGFTHGNQTVTFTTAGTKTISGSATTFYNLTVGDGTDVSTTVTNGLTPLSLGGVLTIKQRTTSNTNTFNTGGQNNFILLSNSDVNIGTGSNYGGSIGPLGTGTVVSGSLTAQRYASDKNRTWRYISAPVIGATVAQLKAAIPITGVFSDPSDASSTPPCSGCNTTNPSLYYYNETTSAYVAFPAAGQTSAGTTFINGRGYSAFFRHEGIGGVGGPVTINYLGTNPTTSGVSLPVSPSSGTFSLVGNPYPCPIVWGSAGWNMTNIATVMYVPEIASGTDLTNVAHDISENFVIAPGQAFWVQSSATGASLTINETAKYTGAAGYQFFRKSAPVLDQLNISLTTQGSGITDNAYIKIRGESKAAFDIYDGVKFDSRLMNGDVELGDPFGATPVFNIAILSDDPMPKALAYSAVPSVSLGQIFNLKLADLMVAAQNTTDYTLTATPFGELSAFTWILHDHYTGMDVNLSKTSTYNFTVDNSIYASKSETRFTIKAGSPADIDEGIDAQVRVYPNPVSETINVVVNKQEPVQVNLLSITGQLVSDIKMEKEANGWNGKYDVRSQPKGMYIVRILSGGGNIAYKIVVQ